MSINLLLFALVSKRNINFIWTPKNCNGIQSFFPRHLGWLLGKIYIYLNMRRNWLMTSPSLEQVMFVGDTGRFHSVSFFPQFLGSHDFNSHSSFIMSSELGNCFESFQYRNHLWLQKDRGLGGNCITKAWRANMPLSPYQNVAFPHPALNSLC